jgi:hypothetical protein
MMSQYREVWSTVSQAVDEEGQVLRKEKSRRLQQFYNDKWKAANNQVRVERQKLSAMQWVAGDGGVDQ